MKISKKCLLFAVAVVFCGFTEARELKVLMVGNSFSQSVLTYLPRIVNTDKENKLVLAQCYIGGCTFGRHMESLNKSLKNPGYKPYTTNYPNRRKVNLPEMIKLEKWDIVTIQQGSRESWWKEKYKPADELIAYIRKNSPNAEIVVHQTWSYRNSDKRISGTNPVWGFDQQGMYDRLTENYTDLAKKYGFRIIPVGKAIQLFRELTPVKYTAPTAAELKSYVYPDLPRRAGDVVGADLWGKDKKSGEMVLRSDHTHLNNEGEYLQACVWYGFLFRKNPTLIKFIPDNIGNTQAKFLQSCAQKAIDTFPQAKK